MANTNCRSMIFHDCGSFFELFLNLIVTIFPLISTKSNIIVRKRANPVFRRYNDFIYLQKH